MIKLSLDTVVSDIIYNTIREYQNSEQFKKYPLENYDNWKDSIKERILDYILNHYELSKKE